MNKLTLMVPVLIGFGQAANAATTTYWNLFNIEGESTRSAFYATYGTLDDMLRDENRTGSGSPDGEAGGQFAANVVGSGSDGESYWNLFNIEGESTRSAFYATYGTLDDMLRDENRAGSGLPDGEGGGQFAANVVGSGSDGESYWNLFNIEGESTRSAFYATYAALEDMLRDESRTGSGLPDGEGGGQFAANVVGSGSDGESYWNLFNIEGESSRSAFYATYGTLDDMLRDENRTGSGVPDGEGGGQFAANVVGSGAFVASSEVPPIPLPATAWFLLTGLGGLMAFRYRRLSLGKS